MRVFLSSMVRPCSVFGVRTRGCWREAGTALLNQYSRCERGKSPRAGSHVRHGASGRRAHLEGASRLSENQQCLCKGATEGRLMSGAMTSYEYYADCIAVNP